MEGKARRAAFGFPEYMFEKDPRLPDRHKLGWSFWPPRQYNPGSYDNMNRESREVVGQAQEPIDGFRLDVQKTLGQFWSTQHSLALSNDQNVQKYAFSISGHLSDSVQMMGRVDSDWTVSGKWAQQLTNDLQVRLSGQASHDAQGSNGAVEASYRGTDWFGDFVWSNPGLFRAAYNQSITRRLSVGGELAYNHQQAASFGTMTARYWTSKWIFTTALALPAIQLSWCRNLGDAMRVAVETFFSFNPQTAAFESKTDLAYLAFFPWAQLAGSIDTHLHAHSQITSHFGDWNDNIVYTLAGDFDFKKKKFGVGLGVQLTVD